MLTCCLFFEFSALSVLFWVHQPVQNLAKTLTERGAAAPVACHICSDEFEEAYNHEAKVFHGELEQAGVVSNITHFTSLLLCQHVSPYITFVLCSV